MTGPEDLVLPLIIRAIAHIITSNLVGNCNSSLCKKKFYLGMIQKSDNLYKEETVSSYIIVNITVVSILFISRSSPL